MPRQARLTRDDWAAAALDALAEGGPAAVAVEPVAARLGASKSSFYWLFGNRQALLEAALERWERVHTVQVQNSLAGIADPRDRLRQLAHGAILQLSEGNVTLRLLIESSEPAVRAVVERVTRRRLEYLEATYRELGQPPDLARNHATAIYATYLGTAALRLIDASPQDAEAYVNAIVTAFSGTR